MLDLYIKYVYLYIIYIYIQVYIYIYIYIQIFLKCIHMCVYLYMHNKYTQYTHI